MSARYFAIRVSGTTRIEKAETSREACRLAFGTIYDDWESDVRYLDLGTSKNLVHGLLRRKTEDEWKRIPPPKGVKDVTFEVQKCEIPAGWNNLNHYLGSLPCVVRALQSDDGKLVKVRLDTTKKGTPFFGLYVQDQSTGGIIIHAPSVLDKMPMPSSALPLSHGQSDIRGTDSLGGVNRRPAGGASSAKTAEDVRKALVGFALEPRDRTTILDMVKTCLERDESEHYLTDLVFDPANSEEQQSRINKVALSVRKLLLAPLLLLTILTILCCGCYRHTAKDAGHSAEQPIRERSLSVGDHAIVTSKGMEEVVAATDDDADNELHKLARAKDTQGLQRMLLSGKALLVPVGTKVLVLGSRTFTVETRILEGDYEGKLAFFDKEFLTGR